MTVQLHPVESTTQKSQRARSMDIVFMHGLGGHHETTWQGATDAYWPQWVADAFPQAKVWALDYPAALGGLTKGSAENQPGAQPLADAIADCFRNQTPQIGSRPCLFVCHSLGGLLIKRILLDAKCRKDDRQWFREQHVVGVMFCGTPHRGSDVADVLTMLQGVKTAAINAGAKVAAIWAGIGFLPLKLGDRFVTTTALIEYLKKGSGELQALNEDFGRYYAERAASVFPLDVRIYMETGTTKGVMIVDGKSADPNLSPGTGKPPVSVIPAYGPDHKTVDHSELVKPISKSDTVVHGLQSFINSVVTSNGIFDLNDATRNQVALTVFKLLNKQNADLATAIGSLLLGGPSDVYKVAEALAQLPADEVSRVLMEMPDLHVRHLSGAEKTLQKIGVTLLGLMLDSQATAVSLSIVGPVQLTTPAFDSAESRGIFSELVHATFRGWSPHFRVADDSVTIEPDGWRMVSEAVEDLSSWNPLDHFNELVHCILAEQSNLSRRSSSHPKKLAVTKDHATPGPSNLQPADRLPRARALLKAKFHQQMSLMVETDDQSPLRDPVLQEMMKREFGDLMTLVLSDASQDAEPLRNRIQGIQVTAQLFLGTLLTQQGKP
jgi:hypothetical protein